MRLIDEFRATLSNRKYLRDEIQSELVEIVQTYRTKTTDEDALRIARKVTNLLIAELRWLDAREKDEHARN